MMWHKKIENVKSNAKHNIKIEKRHITRDRNVANKMKANKQLKIVYTTQ